MIPAGKLDKRVELQAFTSVEDGMGGTTDSFVSRVSVWAGIFPMTGMEWMRAYAMTMAVTHRIIIRYRTDIKPSWRIKYGNRIFAIITILNMDEGEEKLEIMVKEVAA